MSQVILTLIAFFLVVGMPFLLLCVYTQKLLYGNPNAKRTACRLGFHQTNVQRFDANDYVNREICELCGFTFPRS